MDSRITCGHIQDKLEALAAGALPDEEFLTFMSHVDQCPDCAMLVRLQQHTAMAPAGELETLVPDELVDGMYGRVMEGIRKKEQKHSRFRLRGPVSRWIVPALSTAVVVLLAGGTLMLHELRELQQREHALSERIERQERFRREDGHGSAPSVGIRDRLVLASGDRTRGLPRRGKASVAQLQSILERLPPSTQILDAEGTAALITRYDRWMGGRWKAAATGIDARDGLQADEMIRLIRALDPDPNARIPMARLISLSQRMTPRARLLSD